MTMENNSTASSVVPRFPMTFKLEELFDADATEKWLARSYHHSFYYVLAYFVSIVLCEAYMINKKAFRLKWPMVAWNISLSVFSICGTLRMCHELFYSLYHFGFDYTICDNRYITASSVIPFWMYYFLISKVLELMDTIFVILRKQNLIFLHWFHHSSVLIFSWVTAADRMAMGRWFISMNFALHSLMYTYYAFRALKVRIPKRLAMFITLAQLSQMFIGFYISINGFEKWYNKSVCAISSTSAIFGISIYTFYFILFCNFFAQSYLKPALSDSHKRENQAKKFT